MFGKPTQVSVSPTPDDALFARLNDMKEGERISHTECAKILGHPIKSPNYYRFSRRAIRKLLTTTGFAVVTIRGEGYMKAAGIDQVKHAVTYQKRGMRSLGRAHRVASMVEDARLDTQGKAQRDFVVTRTKQLRDMLRAEQRSLTLAVNKPELLPPK